MLQTNSKMSLGTKAKFQFNWSRQLHLGEEDSDVKSYALNFIYFKQEWVPHF